MCCVLTTRTESALPNPGRALQSKAPAGRSSSPAHQASAFGNGLGRQSKSLIEIRRNPIAFGSSTPAEPCGLTRPVRGRGLRPLDRPRGRAFRTSPEREEAAAPKRTLPPYEVVLRDPPVPTELKAALLRTTDMLS